MKSIVIFPNDIDSLFPIKENEEEQLRAKTDHCTQQRLLQNKFETMVTLHQTMTYSRRRPLQK